MATNWSSIKLEKTEPHGRGKTGNSWVTKFFLQTIFNRNRNFLNWTKTRLHPYHRQTKTRLHPPPIWQVLYHNIIVPVIELIISLISRDACIGLCFQFYWDFILVLHLFQLENDTTSHFPKNNVKIQNMQ